jgi:hypothetical protein
MTMTTMIELFVSALTIRLQPHLQLEIGLAQRMLYWWSDSDNPKSFRENVSLSCKFIHSPHPNISCNL